MLEKLNIEFFGTLHSGLVDVTNIGQIDFQLIKV